MRVSQGRFGRLMLDVNLCRHVPSFVLMVALSTGCAWQENMRAQETRAESTGQDLTRRLQMFKSKTEGNASRVKAQRVSKPWIVGPAVPLAKEVNLPPALREKVDTTLMYAAGKADLVTIAERITLATGIAVRIRPDALLPAEQFLPRLSGTVPAVTTVAAPWQASTGRGKQPLSRLLDTISRRLGVNWRYANDHIEFYRTQTRVFDVRVLTLAAQSEVKLAAQNTPRQAALKTLPGHRCMRRLSTLPSPFAPGSSHFSRAQGMWRCTMPPPIQSW